LRPYWLRPGAIELPAAATEALTEATGLIAQFQQENLGAASIAALSGVTSASAAVRQAAGVPALLAQLSEVSARADDLLESVSVGSELNYEAVSAIRDIRDAARAVTELIELAQQKPTSFIFGK
jgi:paraquat-inducible protein B